jgi:hypothetical protein
VTLPGFLKNRIVTAIGPLQQLIDVTIRMAIDDPGERVGQVGERIDVIQLTGFNQRGDDGPNARHHRRSLRTARFSG